MATLVYHAGALGDFITSLPALRYWKERMNPEPLVLLGKPAFAVLARESGVIAQAFDADDRRYLPLFCDRFSPEAAALLRTFSAAIIFSGGDSPLLANVNASGIGPVYAQPPFPDRAIHIADYHLSLFADPAGLYLTDRTPRIFVPEAWIAASQEVVTASPAFCTIHPGSGSAKKNWPPERFDEVAGILRRQGYRIAWLAGPAEEGWRFPGEDLVVREYSLCTVAGLLSRSAVHVGNDSGITHLAAAVGCPVVAIFGASDPAVWAPRGDRVKIVLQKVACGPCHRQIGAPQECIPRCMESIVTDMVAAAITGIRREVHA